MTASNGLIYEVTLTIEREIVESFDQWLVEHVQEMLAIPGFVSARVFSSEDHDEGHVQRVTHYYLEDEEQLERYFTEQAEAMRQSGIDRFGDQFRASRRILRQSDLTAGGIDHTEACRNCGTTLSGQYCGHCGQRARSRLISLWELISDAFGDLFELDSRIWRTMGPLLLRPGKLTYDYLQGRRARFMPPFRTYLVLSIVFFLVLLFDPKEEFSLVFDPEPDATEKISEDTNSAEELAEEGIVVSPETSTPVQNAQDAEPIDAAGNGQDDSGDSTDGLQVSAGIGDDDDCTLDESERLDLPDWFTRRISPERLEAICEKVLADDGKALLAKLADNIPAALFFLLPLMAFVLKLLYPLSKRYYVEHLLFVVHYHAFFFLILILQMFYSRLGDLLRFPGWAIAIPLFATGLYIPVYLYKAMRRVYEQRRLITAPKFIVMVMAYFAGLAVIFSVTVLFAVFSI